MSEAPRLEAGLSGHHSISVDEKRLASAIGSGKVNVFATAMMIAGMEACAVETVEPFLPPGATTVGAHIDVSHDSATPAGLKVDFYCKLVKVEGRSLFFEVSARDSFGLIGKGTHKRVIVDREKFERRAMSKLSQDSAAPLQSPG